jgi:large repetitive protein
MKYAKIVRLYALLVAAACSAATAAALSPPVPLPGMTGLFPATGKQEKPQITKGGETSLAVWSDTRTALAPNGTMQVGGGGPYLGQGLGTMNDIYAARLDKSGNVIDRHPIVVSQASYNQNYPQVAWNGQNWLVVWYQELENDHLNYEMRGVRVSPNGTVLDATPITIGTTSNNLGSFPASLLFDGTNWVVFWEGFNANQTARSIFAARIAADGTVFDPQGLAVYNHPTQNLTDPDVAYNGSGFLLVFHDLGNQQIYGLRLTQDLAPAGTKFPINTFAPSQPTKPQVASHGGGYLVVWDEHPFSGNIGGVTGSRVSATGQVLDPNGLIIDDNVGVSESFPNLIWNGTNWFVTYTSGYYSPTDSYNQQSIYLRRVSSAGAVLDANPIRISDPAFPALFPAITTGFGNSVQVVWHDLRADQDIYTAQVSTGGIASQETAVSLGAPRQSRPRMAFGGGVFLTVFQREIAGRAQIVGQRLDSAGNALDAEPFRLSEGPNQTNRNPSVAFNGTSFLVVWDRTQTDKFGNTLGKVYGRLVSTGGTPLSSPFFVMDGVTPDVAALGDTFLTVVIRPVGEFRSVESVRVNGAGVVLGSPAFVLGGNFSFAPRVAALGNRWLVVWEYHSRHDASTSWIRAAFVEPAGTAAPSFQVAISDNPISMEISFDDTPHLAVAGNKALIVWADNDTNQNNIKGRRIQADGTLLGSNFGFVISNAPGNQFSPAVAWDGSQYIATWLDQRNEQFPIQPRGDIYAARISPNGAILAAFPVANSAAPEETPFVASANGVTVFAYSAFYDHAPYSAMRVTTRTSSSAP